MPIRWVPIWWAAGETARDGEFLRLGSRGVEELEEERSPGRPVPLDRELAGHGRGEPDAIRVDVVLRASRDLRGRVRHEELPHEPAAVGEAVGVARRRGQEQEPDILDRAGGE